MDKANLMKRSDVMAIASLWDNPREPVYPVLLSCELA